MTPALEIEGVSLRYGAIAALKAVSLHVARGEFVALLGPSGCGKTSLLRAIAGFAHPQAGRIRLNGRDVASLPPRQRNIGLVFQSYALFPHMSVLDNVRFGLECRRVPRQQALARTRDALALVGLEGMADRHPRQLSGGQQQRVALARALVIEPDLLLLDEPLGALDKQLRVQMQTELKALQQRLGVAAVFVTHDQEEAMSMADRIAVMRDGVIEQVDAPEQLFVRPRTAWIGEFIDSGNLVRGVLEPAGPGRLRLPVAPGSGFEVAGDTAGNAVVLVPRDRVDVRHDPDERGLRITARRYLGLSVELHMAYAHGTLCAVMPQGQAALFPVGTPVRVSAGVADCRLVRDV